MKPPWSAQQVLQWTGILNDPDEPHQTLSFSVLCGPGGPVPTGGWSTISTIDRARRLGFTMPTGYPPASMDVPVRFDGTVNYGTHPANNIWTPSQIEYNIQVLEWMAGRGKLYGNGTHPAQGDPPIVQCSSFMADGVTVSNLVPPNFQSNAPTDLRWLVSNLRYGSPLHGPLGDRTFQDITVSLTQYVAVPGAPPSPRNRQKGRGTNTSGYKIFTSTQALDTIAKVCQSRRIRKAQEWATVATFNQQYNPALRSVRSYHQTLTPGTPVFIPIGGVETITFGR